MQLRNQRFSAKSFQCSYKKWHLWAQIEFGSSSQPKTTCKCCFTHQPVMSVLCMHLCINRKAFPSYIKALSKENALGTVFVNSLSQNIFWVANPVNIHEVWSMKHTCISVLCMSVDMIFIWCLVKSHKHLAHLICNMLLRWTIYPHILGIFISLTLQYLNFMSSMACLLLDHITACILSTATHL